MSQKTLSDHLRDQTQNARNWLNQKVPGTRSYTRKQLALDVLIGLLKPAPKTAHRLYDNSTLNGYYYDGPEGPGVYRDGYRVVSHDD